MSPPTSPKVPYTQAQRREAAEWFVLIHSEDDPMTESSQAWLRWVDQDEGNRLAFESVVQAWHATPVSSALAMPSAEDLQADPYDGDQSVGEWLAQHSATRGAAIHRTRVPRGAWLTAASLVFATLVLFTMNRYLNLRGSAADEFTTKTGEQIEITLADGSRVWLGPQSRLLVGFTQERRGMQLATGEAYFSVKKDLGRPFTVRSLGGDITAVGTAFNVRAAQDHVMVAVSEGVVTVVPKTQLTAREPAAIRVASGQQLSFTAQAPIKALAITQTPTPGERARWRDGVLVYRDEPLRDVVMDVVRYSDKQIEIADAAIGDLHYSGVVYQGAVDEWTAALPESFPVKIVSDGNRAIIEAR